MAALERRRRLRTLAPARGLDFSSNDYLGFSGSGELKRALADALDDDTLDIGSGGSRLLRGNHPEHEALESEAASFFGAEAALYFNTGFAGNAALLAVLPQRGDLIIHDALVHASAHDGMGLTKAEIRAARHNDANAFADLIADWRAGGGTGTPFIAVESLYSMDGDIAPLDDLAAIADQHDGVLLVDEAHATGVFGPRGRGLAAHLEGRDNVVTLHTCGKALGVSGGLVCGPKIVRDFLINRAKAFIYATAPSPVICRAVRIALRLTANADDRRDALRRRITHADDLLAKALGLAPTGTQIKPVIIGRETATLSLADALQAGGFDVRAIRPPTVPEGTSRLRIAISVNVSEDDIAALTNALSDIIAACCPDGIGAPTASTQFANPS